MIHTVHACGKFERSKLVARCLRRQMGFLGAWTVAGGWRSVPFHGLKSQNMRGNMRLVRAVSMERSQLEKCDLKGQTVTDDPLFAGQNISKLRTELGSCNMQSLYDTDRLVVSPGISLQKYNLASLMQSGKQVTSELDFAAEALPTSVRIVAVTGTNGKSTVATFTGQILQHAGFHVFLGGNLGRPLSDAALQCLSSSTELEYEVAVVEVSSYQMEIPNRHFHPSVAVVLNLTPDHLERHKTMWNYARMKCRVFSHMDSNHLAVIPSMFEDKQRILWVDDSKATNVEATYTGLKGLKDRQSVILLGGLAKVLNKGGDIGFERLVEILQYHRAVITFGISGKKIKETLDDAGLSIPCVEVTSMRAAVSMARNFAKHGDIILLSPGCASFDEFNNFEHRGKVFQELAMSPL